MSALSGVVNGDTIFPAPSTRAYSVLSAVGFILILAIPVFVGSAVTNGVGATGICNSNGFAETFAAGIGEPTVAPEPLSAVYTL